MCKYHIIFIPKYRQKIIYSQLKTDTTGILKQLYFYKGAEILEGHFWSEGYYVSIVGLNEVTIRKYIQDQEKCDIMQDKLSVKKYENPFKG